MEFIPGLLKAIGLTAVAYMLVPLILLECNGGRFEKRRANKIALWNSVAVGGTFCILTMSLTGLLWNHVPAVGYYLINRAILTKWRTGKQVKSSSNTNSSLVRRPIRRWFPVFIIPTFLCFCIGFIWPFIHGIYLSFCNFNIPKDAQFVGFENYTKVFRDQGFRNAFMNTASFAVVSIVLINVVAFAIAYALTQKMKGSNLFRTVFFMPNLIGGVVLGFIWSILIDYVLTKMGAAQLILNSGAGFWGLVILVAWQQIGYMMIIYIAGLQAVPEDMLEAARIDGASRWKTLIKVTIPNVMPSITICTFLTLTNSFKMFDQNLALTGGLPQIIENGAKVNKTELLALNIYSTYQINKNWHGVAQAKAVIFFILVAVLALAQQAATRRKEVQQ